MQNADKLIQLRILLCDNKSIERIKGLHMKFDFSGDKNKTSKRDFLLLLRLNNRAKYLAASSSFA